MGNTHFEKARIGLLASLEKLLSSNTVVQNSHLSRTPRDSQLGVQWQNLSSLQLHTGHEDCSGMSIRRCESLLQVKGDPWGKALIAECRPNFPPESFRCSKGGSRYIEYRRTLPIGTVPPRGPPATLENILYYTSVQDVADYSVSSKIHYQLEEMAFGTDFVPCFEHFPMDDFPVPPSPAPCD